MTAAAAAIEVLAEPSRRRLVELLGVGELTVGEMVERAELTQPAVSKHLRVLRDAGLVEVCGRMHSAGCIESVPSLWPSSTHGSSNTGSCGPAASINSNATDTNPKGRKRK